jgi:hypothetical protein
MKVAASAEEDDEDEDEEDDDEDEEDDDEEELSGASSMVTAMNCTTERVDFRRRGAISGPLAAQGARVSVKRRDTA